MHPFPRHATLLLLFVLAACGRSGHADAVRRQLALGRLEVAESLLQAVEGPQAEVLEARLADMRARRESIAESLDGFRDRRGSQLGMDLQDELERLLAPETDPVIREWIQREASDTADWVAERNAKRPSRRIWLPGLGLDAPTAAGGSEPDDQPVRARVDDPLLEALLADVASAEKDGSWQQALALVDAVLADAPELGGRLYRRRVELLDRAALDAEDVLLSTQRLDRQRGTDEARAYLAGELWRFPDQGGAAGLYRAFEELDARQVERVIARTSPTANPPTANPPTGAPPTGRELALAAAKAIDSEPAGTSIDPGTSARTLAQRAAVESHADHLATAAELWHAAAERSQDEDLRARYELAAWDAEQRRGLRAALAGAFAADPDLFRDLGANSIEVEELVWGGATITWRDLSWDNVVELHGRAVGSTELDADLDIDLALTLEKLQRDMGDGPRGGLADLARLMDRGVIESGRCWALVALWRGEPVPGGGYTFRDGVWRSPTELEEARLGTELDALAKALEGERGAAREEAFERFAALARGSVVGSERLTNSLEVLRQSAVKAVEKGRTLEQLARVERLRSQLDAARAHALELIFDTEVYFYPYNPPADPDKTISDYWTAQREVDLRVGTVREIWENPIQVELPRSFRRALEDLAWVRARGSSLGRTTVLNSGAYEMPLSWPAWVGGLEPSRESVNLASFAWDAREREALAHDRAVRDIPERRTTHDRLLSAGYARGTGENCHSGRGDPKGAHDAWVQSSGHHRNILMATHREMASARASGYWTQDFGNGDEFESELDEWRD